MVDALGGARDVTNDRRPRCSSISPFQGGDRLVVLLVRELYVPLAAADFKEEGGYPQPKRFYHACEDRPSGGFVNQEIKVAVHPEE